jgi:hypothetical protein
MTAIVDAYADRLKTSKEACRLDALLVRDPEWKNAWRSIERGSARAIRPPLQRVLIGTPRVQAALERRRDQRSSTGVLLTPDSLAGLFLLSLLPSDDFFASSPFLGCEAGLNAIG